jgi:phosphatidylglycerol:prolipoprotein diacylglycerol transferase
MLQELFRIPGINLPVYGYGLMLVLGLFAAIQLAKYLAGKFGMNGDDFVTAGILALISGIVGARLCHVLENFGTYTDAHRSAWENFVAAINLREGGLTYYGGFLFATPVLIVWGLKKKIPVLLGMDIVAPCLMVGLAFGRIGCLLNGCCWGQTCDLAWGMRFPFGSYPYVADYEAGAVNPPPQLLGRTEDGRQVLLPKSEIARDPTLKLLASQNWSAPHHPAQVLSSITAFLIAATCLAYLTVRRSPGQVFALMLILEGSGRFTLELLRVNPNVVTGFSLSMVISSSLVAGGILFWLLTAWLSRRNGDEDATPAVPAPT